MKIPHCIERLVSFIESSPENYFSAQVDLMLARMMFLWGIDTVKVSTHEGHTMILGLTGCYFCTCERDGRRLPCEHGTCYHFSVSVRELTDKEGKPVITDKLFSPSVFYFETEDGLPF